MVPMTIIKGTGSGMQSQPSQHQELSFTRRIKVDRYLDILRNRTTERDIKTYCIQ